MNPLKPRSSWQYAQWWRRTHLNRKLLKPVQYTDRVFVILNTRHFEATCYHTRRCACLQQRRVVGRVVVQTWRMNIPKSINRECELCKNIRIKETHESKTRTN